MEYKLTKPCGSCPFRSDKFFPLHPDRVMEIAQGSGFACHKTVDYSEDQNGTKTEQQCAGRLIMLEHMGHPDQMMRISERFGFYDRTKLDMDAPVYESVYDYLDAIKEHEAQ